MMNGIEYDITAWSSVSGSKNYSFSPVF